MSAAQLSVRTLFLPSFLLFSHRSSLESWMHGMVAGPTDRQTRTATAAALIESRLFCLSWWGRALPSLPPRRSLICPLNKVGRKTATRGEPVHFDKREQDGPLTKPRNAGRASGRRRRRRMRGGDLCRPCHLSPPDYSESRPAPHLRINGR